MGARQEVFILFILLFVIVREFVCDRQLILDALEKPSAESLVHEYDMYMSTVVLRQDQFLDIAVGIQKNNTKLIRLIMDRVNLIAQISKCNLVLHVKQHAHKCGLYNFWIVDGYESFLKIFEQAQHQNRHFANNYLIELNSKPSPNDVTTIQKILLKMFQIEIINVYISVHGLDEDILIYTYFPFTEQHCHKVVPVVINRFVNSSLHPRLILPNTIYNFHKCSLRVYTRNVTPYMIPYNDKYGQITYSGFEAKLLKTIAKQLNFRFNISFNNSDDGTVSSDVKLIFPFDLLHHGMTDILMGFFTYAPLPLQYLSQTRSYATAKLVAIVAMSENSNNSEWILAPFSLDTWLTLALLYTLLVFVAMLIVSPIGRRYQSILMVLATTLGLAYTVRITRKHHKLALIVWCICFLVIRSAYQGKIYDCYRKSHFVAPPDSLDDLEAQKYLIFSPYKSNRDNSFPKAPVVFSFMERNPHKKIAAVVNFDRFFSYLDGKKKTNAFEMVPKIVQLQQMCAYFRRHSYLTEPFNHIIRHLSCFGLIDKWFRSYSFNEMGFKARTARNANPKPMTFAKFKWLFAAFGVMMLFALIVFLIEIFTYRRYVKV